MKLSVIIPTLNEELWIGATLDAVARVRGSLDVIVVDGGSGDATAAVARRRGVSVMTAPRGRGSQ